MFHGCTQNFVGTVLLKKGTSAENIIKKTTCTNFWDIVPLNSRLVGHWIFYVSNGKSAALVKQCIRHVCCRLTHAE